MAIVCKLHKQININKCTFLYTTVYVILFTCNVWQDKCSIKHQKKPTRLDPAQLILILNLHKYKMFKRHFFGVTTYRTLNSLHFSLNFPFSFSRSWFSKLIESILACFAVKSSPAQLKRCSQAADAGRSVLSLRDNFFMSGNKWSKSILSDGLARYPSSSPVPSDRLVVSDEKKILFIRRMLP